jgi:uncharacterized membrane protein YfcA
MTRDLLIAAAGLVAGVMNAMAGGGSFLTFPVLLFAGVPSVAANATSTMALFPGGFASAYGFRRILRQDSTLSLRLLLPITLVGGIAGAILLLVTPNATFDAVVPWLMLAGTLAFAFGRELGGRLRRRFAIGKPALLTSQFLLGLYAGYFGGAVGLMMMAVWSLFGFDDLRVMNAAKSAIVSLTNAVAVICFVVAGLVVWHDALVMGLAAVAGGYLGARLSLRMDQSLVRLVINLVNVAMTAILFWRAFAS